MNFCRDCKKTIYKKDETIIFREFGYCDECAKPLVERFTERDKEIFFNEHNYYKWKQESYFKLNRMYSKLIEFGYTTEEELNTEIPDWKETEEKERQYREQKYIDMKKYWSDKQIEKFKRQNEKEYEYYNKRLN